MREKITLCIALVCILVYAAAVGFGAFQIHDNIQNQRALSKTEYVYLKNLSVYTAQSLGFMSEAYKAEMSRALFATKTIQAFIISGSNNSFAEERRSGLVTVINGDLRLQRNPALIHYDEALEIEGVRNPYINAAADLFDHTFFIIILKNTLLVILAALAVVFFTFIANSLIIKNAAVPEVEEEPQDKHDDSKDMFNIDDEPVDFEIPPIENTNLDISLEDSNGADNELPQDEDFPLQDFFADASDDFDIRSEDISSDSSDSSDDDHAKDAVCEGPQGLYSPHGNISWEAYTKDRLASELHRCSSYEQDMVFIIMEFRRDRQNDDEFFNTFAEMAVTFFGHRDMIFEWKESGISIIVPNIDLDEGIAKCEDFHSRVKTRLLQSSSLDCELCIGLSSRAGRLIDPDRLMFETAEAVARALVDSESPIIAFRPDLEKYRSFIAGQNS